MQHERDISEVCATSPTCLQGRVILLFAKSCNLRQRALVEISCRSQPFRPSRAIHPAPLLQTASPSVTQRQIF